MAGVAEWMVRVAVEADAEELRRLIEASVRGLMGAEYSAAQTDGALGNALGLDMQLVRDGTYFVAIDPADGKTLAASGGWSYRKTLFGSDGAKVREPERLDPAVDAAKIRAIFVHPSYARRGLGKLMLHHCEAAAVAAGFKRLEMGATLTGVPLYAKEGYVAVEEVKVPLPNGEALAVVKMVKGA